MPKTTIKVKMPKLPFVVNVSMVVIAENPEEASSTVNFILNRGMSYSPEAKRVAIRHEREIITEGRENFKL